MDGSSGLWVYTVKYQMIVNLAVTLLRAVACVGEDPNYRHCDHEALYSFCRKLDSKHVNNTIFGSLDVFVI